MRSMTGQTVYVVMPVHNNVDMALDFLEGIQRQSYADKQVVLVDDGSTDGLADRVGEKYPDAVILRGNGDLWWGGGLHKAFLWIKGEVQRQTGYVLLANIDTCLDEDFLARGAEVLARHPDCMLVPNVYRVSNREFYDTGIYRYRFSDLSFVQVQSPEAANCANTRGLMMSVDNFLRIGGFRPKLLPHYLSDIEFTFRAIKKGVKPLSVHEHTLYADIENTGVKGESFLQMTFRDRVRTLFSKRYDCNPVYMINFLLLACPRRYLAQNVVRVIQGAIFSLCKKSEARS